MYRCFLYQGQVTDRIDSYENADVLSADADAAAEVAAALHVAVDTITVVHADSLSSVAVVIPPTVAYPQPPSLETQVAALLAVVQTLAPQAVQADPILSVARTAD